MRHLLHLVVCSATTSTSSWVPNFQQEQLLQKGHIDAQKLSRLFVISDVHGDFQALMAAIHLAAQAANKVASPPIILPNVYDLADIFRKATDDVKYLELNDQMFPLFRNPEQVFYLVQMGDLIDKGDASRRCLKTMELVSRIMGGFEVIQLLGNHELKGVLAMTYAKNKGYLNPEDDLLRNNENTEFLWDYIERNMILMARIDAGDSDSVSSASSAATLFVHAGISPKSIDRLTDHPGGQKMLVDESNFQLLEYVASRNLEALGLALDYGDSPVWTRDMARASTDCEAVEEILKHLNVARIVVGHSAQTKSHHVGLNCGGKVILTDTAMSFGMRNDGTIHPAVTVMDFAKGRLVGIQAQYWNDYEVIVNSDGTPHKSSLSATVKKIMKSYTGHYAGVLMETNGVTIKKYEYGKGSRGVVVAFAADDSKASTIRRLNDTLNLIPHLGLPRFISITNKQMSEKNDDDDMYLLESTATAMLSAGEEQRYMSHIEELRTYLATTLNICWDAQIPLQDIFGVSAKGRVELLNLSALVECG